MIEALGIPSATGDIHEEKEVTAIDYFGSMTDKNVRPFSRFKLKMKYGMFAKLVFCERNGCWSVERKTKGTVDHSGWFTPFPGQAVTYKIFVGNGKTIS